MKQLLVSICIWIMFTGVVVYLCGCEKGNEPAPVKTVPSPTNKVCDVSKLVDILWISGNSDIFADLKFYSNGVMYEEGKVDGTWSITSGCDSLHIINSNNYYNKIISATNDTLKLQLPMFGVVAYHK